MDGWNFNKTSIKGVYEINHFSVGDKRGFFEKTFEYDVFLNSIDEKFFINEIVQSTSNMGVLRGIHFQKKTQAKVVRCLEGKIWDVVVDLRKGSPTLGKWISFELEENSDKEIFVPHGCGHGFYTMSEKAIVQYYISGKYDKASEMGIHYLDKYLNIDWPIRGGEVIVSERDCSFGSFETFQKDNRGGLVV